MNLTGYSLKSGYAYHLLKWVIEGSNDAEDWKVLDSRDTGDLNGKWIVKTYSCSSSGSESYRYLRLRQTGRNSEGRDCLVLSAIEFFGKLTRN